MASNPLPDDHHYTLLVGKMQQTEDGRVTGAAFLPRINKNEPYRSGGWVEFFQEEPEREKFAALLAEMKSNLKVGSTAILPKVPCGNAKSAVGKCFPDVDLAFNHIPLEGYCCHSGICGVADCDPLVGELIASTVSAQYSIQELEN